MGRYLKFVADNFTVYTQAGDEVKVLCCFHEDRHPSMYVNTARGLYYCHSCGAKGSIDQIAERLGVTLLDTGVSTGSLRTRCRLLSTGAPESEARSPRRPPESYLGRFKFDHPYWASRGFSPEIIRRFGLGYSIRTDQLTIPLRDRQGDLLGVIYRKTPSTPTPGPKYIYPTGTSIGKCLFGSWEVRSRHLTKVALVEGSLDAIACWDARVPALAVLGSRLTEGQASLLRSLGVSSVVLMMDNDRAGRTAIPQIKEMLPGLVVRVGVYRPYWTSKDPGELSPEQRRKMYHSADTWRQHLERQHKDV